MRSRSLLTVRFLGALSISLAIGLVAKFRERPEVLSRELHEFAALLGVDR